MTFSTDSNDTTALLDRVANGNAGALDRLLELLRPYLKRIIHMRMEPALRARVDASDVVQETQVVITKNIEQFMQQRPTSFRIWIRRKGLDRLADQRRRHIATMKRSVLKEQNISTRWSTSGSTISGSLAVGVTTTSSGRRRWKRWALGHPTQVSLTAIVRARA